MLQIRRRVAVVVAVAPFKSPGFVPSHPPRFIESSPSCTGTSVTASRVLSQGEEEPAFADLGSAELRFDVDLDVGIGKPGPYKRSKDVGGECFEVGRSVDFDGDAGAGRGLVYLVIAHLAVTTEHGAEDVGVHRCRSVAEHVVGSSVDLCDAPIRGVAAWCRVEQDTVVDPVPDQRQRVPVQRCDEEVIAERSRRH